MTSAIFPQLVNLISFAILGMPILLIVRNSLSGQVSAVAWQSILLSALAASVAFYQNKMELLGVAVLFLLVKGIFIPRVLNRTANNIGIDQTARPYLGTSSALAVCGALIVVAFYVMSPITTAHPSPTASAIPLAFAGVLIGLFVTVNRRRALTQILGFLTLENSIFLFALLATAGVPFIVELGVFLDVLVAVLIAEIFVYRIKKNFDTLDVGQMGELKG